MATSNPHLFTARHIDRLSGPFVKVLTVSVLFLHGILVALALRSTPLVELGGNGGGGGSGSSTLYVSVLQGQSTSHPASTHQNAVSVEKAVRVKEKSESGLITTPSPAKRILHAVQTNEAKAEKIPQMSVSAQQDTEIKPAKKSANGSKSQADNGVGHDTGDGSTPGSGQGESVGNSFGQGGAGSGPARSVSLSQLKYRHAFRPEYPARSIQRHESGQVHVQVVVDTAGRVHDARVISSSSFDRLDDAALKAARRSTFYPYMEHGRAMFAKAVIPYRFNLNKR